jgi:hypothetical protein
MNRDTAISDVEANKKSFTYAKLFTNKFFGGYFYASGPSGIFGSTNLISLSRDSCQPR